METAQHPHLAYRHHAETWGILTVRRPEALGWLDKNVGEETSATVAKQLRTDQGEDGSTSVLRRLSAE